MCETKSVTSSLYLDMNEGLPDVSGYEESLAEVTKDFVNDNIDEATYEKISDQLNAEIDKGHNYIFVGKVGSFCPVVAGVGGGLLLRDQNGKMYAAAGTKGYRWMEADMVREKGLESSIDESYYNHLVDDAIDAINTAGYPFDVDYNKFVSDWKPVDPEFINKPAEITSP